MELIDKLKELRELTLKKWALEREIREEAFDYAETHRIFENDEIVEVYDEFGRYVCDGVIGGVGTSLFMDELRIKEYADGKCDPEVEKGKLRYEVFALTKNKVASKKHIFPDQHMFYNIKDIRANDISRYIKAKQ
jgi:hypothetical protein